MELTLATLQRARDILKRQPERDVIVLPPRLWAYAKRRGYLRNRNYIFVRARKLGR